MTSISRRLVSLLSCLLLAQVAQAAARPKPSESRERKAPAAAELREGSDTRSLQPLRDEGQLWAPWRAVEMVAHGRALYERHEGGFTGEYFSPTEEFKPLAAHLADFLRFNQTSSLTPYEASALGLGLAQGGGSKPWSSGQLMTRNRQFSVGDRVDFSTKSDDILTIQGDHVTALPKPIGDTSGVVVAVRENQMQVLTAGKGGAFLTVEVPAAQARRVAPALIDGAAIATATPQR